MLPREADAAVHLDAVLRAVLRGDGGQRGGDGRGELERAVVDVACERLVDRAGGVPDRGGGPLGLGDHPCALVLDGLELSDRATELLADLRVLGGGVGGPAGDADALGGQQRRHQGPGELAAQAGQHLVVADLDGVGAHVGDRPQRVDALDRLDLELVGVEDDPFLAAVDGDGQHQQRCLGGGGNGPHLAADDEAAALPGRRQAGVDGVGGDDLTRCQLGEALVVGVVGRDEGAGDGRWDERAGDCAVAELREHDRQLEDAEALPADVLREVQTLQPLVGGGLPVRRRVRDRGLECLVQDLRRRHPRHQ